MRVVLRLLEFFIAVFAIGTFIANYPFVFVGTLGSQLYDSPVPAIVTSKVREYSYYGRYLERFHINYSVQLSGNEKCEGEAIIPIAEYLTLKVGEAIPVKMWRGHCIHASDARFDFTGQCFIWLHLIIGIFLMLNLMLAVYRFLSGWEVHDEPRFVRH